MNKSRALFERLHLEMGCYDCEHADKAALGKSPCCTRAEGIPLPAENGKCTGNRHNLLAVEKQAWYLVHVKETLKGSETKAVRKFESLGELYLALEESLNFCYAVQVDGRQRFPESGSATEGRLKGMLAWEIIGIGKRGTE